MKAKWWTLLPLVNMTKTRGPVSINQKENKVCQYLSLDGPLQKKLKVDPQNQIGKQCSSPQIPTEFRVKWVKTASDLIPFVMDEASTIVHCGRTQMKVFTIDGHAEVMCFKGCHWDCPGHQKGHCGCHCHILQWHYNTR